MLNESRLKDFGNGLKDLTGTFVYAVPMNIFLIGCDLEAHRMDQTIYGLLNVFAVQYGLDLKEMSQGIKSVRGPLQIFLYELS